MMHRAVPLLVDVRMTALTSIRFHEVFGRNAAAMFGLRGAREKLPLRAVPFIVHCFRRHQRIGDAIRVLPGDFARPPRACRDASRHQRQRRKSQAAPDDALTQPPF